MTDDQLECIPAEDRETLLCLDAPTTGFARRAARRSGHWAHVKVCLYGDQASEVATREEPPWPTWMEERFPTRTD